MKKIVVLSFVLFFFGCTTKSIFGRYYSMSSSLGSLDYYVDLNNDGTFKQQYGPSSNVGHWRYIQENGYELSKWINYPQNDKKYLTIYVDIYDNKLVEVPYLDEYNFKKSLIDW